VYDTVKIGLMLVVINFVMAIIRYYFPTERVRDILAKRRWFGLDYLMAALLGMVTPFCSCSSIPLFIGFLGAGIPLGVTFTFLISSPLINEASLYLFPAMFGLKVTIIYNLLGILTAMGGGMLIQKLKLEKWVDGGVLKFKSRKQADTDMGMKKQNRKQLLSYWWQDGFRITRQLILYVILGAGIGAMIHGFVASGLVEKYLASKAWWTVPGAVLLGAPMYANSVSVIPIMEALVGKGVPLGTALAFMTSVVTVSIPEILILKKVMKWQLVGMFLGITIFGIMMIGWLFNLMAI
jgi:uncharacterized protein